MKTELDNLIVNKYKFIRPLGKGSYGFIYQGEHIRTREPVAIKVEPISENGGLVKHETKIYQYLNMTSQKIPDSGIACVKWFGRDESNYYMVLEMLGESLETVKERRDSFSLSTVLQIGIQVVQRLRFLHEAGLVHRDIKPGNFLLGRSDKSRLIYLIDFGFCKRHDQGETRVKVKRTAIIGTPNFISVNVHELNEPERKDDLESLVYMLIYFYLGKLPWEKTDMSLENIMKAKISLTNEREIWEKTIPPMFLNFLEFLRKMNEDKIDYLMLMNILNETSIV